MYNLNIFAKCNVTPTWSLLYYGVEKGYLGLNDVSEFAVQCIEQNDDRIEILELAWKNTDKNYVLNQMWTILKGTIAQNTEMIWKYCIIKTILETYTSFEEVSENLNLIYAEFGYPKEMEEFITYMPSKEYNPLMYSAKENENRIIKKAWEYVSKMELQINALA